MPKYNFRFSVETGKRTKPKVTIYETTKTEKVMHFPNGSSRTNTKMAKRLQKVVQHLFTEFAERKQE